MRLAVARDMSPVIVKIQHYTSALQVVGGLTAFLPRKY